eukprot:SAG25_NODE_4360_length_833_cov_0.975477_2_plen_89_part_00
MAARARARRGAADRRPYEAAPALLRRDVGQNAAAVDCDRAPHGIAAVHRGSSTAAFLHGRSRLLFERAVCARTTHAPWAAAGVGALPM